MSIPPQRRPQFHLRSLLAVIALVAVLLAYRASWVQEVRAVRDQLELLWDQNHVLQMEAVRRAAESKAAEQRAQEAVERAAEVERQARDTAARAESADRPAGTAPEAPDRSEPSSRNILHETQGRQKPDSWTSRGVAGRRDLSRVARDVPLGGELRVRRGLAGLVQFDAPVYRIHVSDPRVADFAQYDSRTIGILGRQRGATTMTFWVEDESRPLHTRVRVLSN
jgi:Flp pilus assembly secretin CpaC